MVELAAEIECLDEGIAGTESAGFGDDDGAVSDATFDDAPGNARGEFTAKQNAGRVERLKNEGRSLAAGEDQSGSRRGSEYDADLVVRRDGPVDAMNFVRRFAVIFETGYLESGDWMVGTDEEKGASTALRRLDGFAATRRWERCRQGAGQTRRPGPEDWLAKTRGGCGEAIKVCLRFRIAEEDLSAGGECAGDSLLQRSFRGGGKKVHAAVFDVRKEIAQHYGRVLPGGVPDGEDATADGAAGFREGGCEEGEGRARRLQCRDGLGGNIAAGRGVDLLEEDVAAR